MNRERLLRLKNRSPCRSLDMDMLEGDTVFVEQPFLQRRVEMHEAARDRASGDAQSNRRFPRLGKIRISVGKTNPEIRSRE